MGGNTRALPDRRQEKPGVSYYTNVDIEFSSEDGSVTADMLLAEARAYLSRFAWYAVEDILSNLAEGFKKRSTWFNDLRCSDLTDLFRALSKKFPSVRLDIWGHGEEFGDTWAVRCLGGKVAVRYGPFDEEDVPDPRAPFPENEEGPTFRPKGVPVEPATWHNCRSHIYGDGASLALMVPDSGLAGWEVLLWALKAGPFELRAFSENEPIPLPSSAAWAFTEQRDIRPVRVAVLAGAITANCRFFGGDIDLDIDPEQLTDEASFESMLAIMRIAAAALRLPVFAVSADQYTEPFLRVSPEGAAMLLGRAP
jgi:hypothetical protein